MESKNLHSRPQCHPGCTELSNKSPAQPSCNFYGHESILPIATEEEQRQYEKERSTFKEMVAKLRVEDGRTDFSVDTSIILANWRMERKH